MVQQLKNIKQMNRSLKEYIHKCKPLASHVLTLQKRRVRFTRDAGPGRSVPEVKWNTRSSVSQRWSLRCPHCLSVYEVP